MNAKYRAYLLSNEWAQLKIDLYAHRGKKCELCGSGTYLQVHHITYENIFKEEPKDLIILCKNCHQKEHPKKTKPKKIKKKRFVVLKLSKYDRHGNNLKTQNKKTIREARIDHKNVRVVYKKGFWDKAKRNK